MRLRDDTFLNAPAEDTPRPHEAFDRQALRGIGDPMQRRMMQLLPIMFVTVPAPTVSEIYTPVLLVTVTPEPTEGAWQ